MSLAVVKNEDIKEGGPPGPSLNIRKHYGRSIHICKGNEQPGNGMSGTDPKRKRHRSSSYYTALKIPGPQNRPGEKPWFTNGTILYFSL
jgi:hypothetical protein